MGDNKSLEGYTIKELLEAKEGIKSELIYGIEPAENPIAFMLGGQPGSGKTGLQKMLSKEYDNLVIINIDEFRKYHPNFKKIDEVYGKDSVTKTNKFAAQITDMLVEELSNNKYNMVIEGTLRKPDTSLESQKNLNAKGYKCELVVIAVKPEMSYIGTKLRYESMRKNGNIPRDTGKDFHDLVVKSLPESLEQIYKKNVFDNIRIFDREKNCLYNQKEMPKINPKDIILNTYNRNRSKKEMEEFKQEIEKVNDLMKERNASISEFEQFEKEYKEELQKIENNYNLHERVINEHKELKEHNKSKDDDFMKEYLEQQKRKSMAQNRAKERNRGIER